MLVGRNLSIAIDLDRLFCACAREVPNTKSADGLEEAAFFAAGAIYVQMLWPWYYMLYVYIQLHITCPCLCI